MTLKSYIFLSRKLLLDEEKKILNSTYLVTNDFNRMAVKVKWWSYKSEINGIISEAIAFGSIQIPNDGQ